MARVRRKPGTQEKLLSLSPPLVKEATKLKGAWQEYFQNSNPIHLELGIGKGGFIRTLARQNSTINYIGIEVVEEVLLKAVENSLDENFANLVFVWTDVKLLPEIFASGEVERIYLNFIDPWPRNKHAKRRLTHKNFLNIYKQVLIVNGQVHFKTDNAALFEFSLNEFSGQNWSLRNINLDLYKNLPEDNVATEYEQKFVEQGLNIYRLEALPPLPLPSEAIPNERSE